MSFLTRRLLLLLLLASATLSAAVTPASIFQNHAVLQRDKPLPIWGTATPGEKVTVAFGGQTRAATTDSTGRWSVTLDPLSANSTPATLTLTGETTVTLTDILVGEVWLASGQSNMEWPLVKSHDADLESLTARFPLIREIKVARTASATPLSTLTGEWRAASPATVSEFSAVAYFFARDLHLALNVPIGILNATWGGTPVEAWMSSSTLDSDPAFAAVRTRWSATLAEYPVKQALYEGELATWQTEKNAAAAHGETFTRAKPRAPQGPDSPHAPAALYNGMIAPLLPFALRGAIWYQGESNAGRAAEYHALFAALIRGWRTDFTQPDFPFYWTQLASYKASSPDETQWAFLREAQTQTLALPATGQAVIIDAALSDVNDIHPRAKLPVGRRLARLALARAYAIPSITDSGPTFLSHTIVPAPADGSAPATLHLAFDRKVRHPARELSGFELAGEDQVFHPASARIEDDTHVVLSSPAVPSPRAARYAWKNAPLAWLQDDLGLPIAPFRTDTW